MAITPISPARHHPFTEARRQTRSVRGTVNSPEEVIRIANLEIRPGEYQLLAGGKRVGLTVREFQTFMVLAERHDRVVSRPEIYARVWGGQMAYRDRSVDVFVRKVRRKLAECAPSWAYIHTHFGIGYRFSPERVAR
jgi:DNA-binding response OmpR family regulator